MKKDAVSAFAAQTAFFIILSFIPFLMLLLTLIQYLPISETALVRMANEMLPHAINTYVISLINEIYTHSSATVISITALMALWSASKGFLSLMHGFNFIYQIPETRNYVRLRLIAAFYTLIFAITLLVSLTILVFGNKIFVAILNKIPLLADVALLVISVRSIVGLIVLFLVFSAMYLWIPNFKGRFFFIIPGAAIASIGWMTFSFAYSYYIDNFANFNTYGSLTILIFCMLWLYACMYILFIGCEINEFLYRTLLSKKQRL
ncbi:MAG: rane protein [Clostridiales bacterium]|nr:rane protein [Clostridiales bacterium]